MRAVLSPSYRPALKNAGLMDCSKSPVNRARLNSIHRACSPPSSVLKLFSVLRPPSLVLKLFSVLRPPSLVLKLFSVLRPPSLVLFSLCVLCASFASFAVSPFSPAFAQDFDALLAEGQAHYQAGRLDEAETVLRKAVERNGKSAPAHYWLGMVYYDQAKNSDALGQFQEAVRRDRKWANGHVGMGLALMRMDNRRLDARRAFREALALTPDDPDINYLMGLTYASQSKYGKLLSAGADGRDYFQKAVTFEPLHPDAYYQLGLSYEYPLQDYDRAIFFYFRQLSVKPDHADALRHFGSCTLITARYQAGMDLLDQLVDLHGPSSERHFRAARAQIAALYHHTQRRYDQAWEAYQAYVASVDEQERALYLDIQYIASPEETQAYQRAPEPEQEQIRRAFWAARDPNPATVVNERLVEHYRRVMVAREYFAGGKFPWDRRGDIYLRYGDPDDRQRFVGGSNEADTFMTTTSLLGNSVRERAPRPQNDRDGESDFIFPTGNARVDAIREINRELRYNLRARGAHASESWVYVRYGVEMFFVDQRGDGNYDYPNVMMDPTALFSLSEAAKQERFSPETLAEILIERAPEDYRHDFGGAPLEFVFDAVTFRGEDGQTEVELTYSVPAWQLGSVQDGKGLRTTLDSHVTLRDSTHQIAVANAEAFGPLDRPMTAQTQRRFNVALHTAAVSLIAEAGKYGAAVEIRDEATRRIGVYEKPITVSDYRGDSLLVSDLKLATSIAPDDGTGDFVRRGLRITPNPGRLYLRGQPVYVYYEIYNLTPDDTGRTGYETLYEIIPRGAVLPRDRRNRERTDDAQSTLLIFEGEGTTPDEPAYTSLDTSELDPGEYVLAVEITDFHTGRRVWKEVNFAVME